MKSQSRSPRPNPPITARQEGKAANRAHAVADLCALERGKETMPKLLEPGRRDGRKRVNVGVSWKSYLLHPPEEDLAMEDKLRPQNLSDPSHLTQVLDGFTAKIKNNSPLNIMNTKQNATTCTSLYARYV